jgi:hypothetical protein
MCDHAGEESMSPSPHSDPLRALHADTVAALNALGYAVSIRHGPTSSCCFGPVLVGTKPGAGITVELLAGVSRLTADMVRDITNRPPLDLLRRPGESHIRALLVPETVVVTDDARELLARARIRPVMVDPSSKEFLPA